MSAKSANQVWKTLEPWIGPELSGVIYYDQSGNEVAFDTDLEGRISEDLVVNIINQFTNDNIDNNTTIARTHIYPTSYLVQITDHDEMERNGLIQFLDRDLPSTTSGV